MSLDNSCDLELQCPQCGEVAICDTDAMVRRLLGLGMLRRNPNPDALEVRELLKAVAGRLACENCGSLGLQIAAHAADDPLLFSACELCGKDIGRERLAIFPEAKRCMACQRMEEQGGAQREAEYCPRCGAPLALRPGG